MEFGPLPIGDWYPEFNRKNYKIPGNETPKFRIEIIRLMGLNFC